MDANEQIGVLSALLGSQLNQLAKIQDGSTRFLTIDGKANAITALLGSIAATRGELAAARDALDAVLAEAVKKSQAKITAEARAVQAQRDAALKVQRAEARAKSAEAARLAHEKWKRKVQREYENAVYFGRR